jgi:hypothetical protein
MHHDSVGMHMHDSHGQKPVFRHVVVFACCNAKKK